MVRVMLSKEQVHCILISMRLSSCLSFSLSPHIFKFFYLKVTKLRVENTWKHNLTASFCLAFYSTHKSEIDNFLQIYYIYLTISTQMKNAFSDSLIKT